MSALHARCGPRTRLDRVEICEAVRTFLDDPYSRNLFIDDVDEMTGMNALHIAVGRNNLDMAKLLIESGIKIIPDGEGRMPSLIAALRKQAKKCRIISPRRNAKQKQINDLTALRHRVHALSFENLNLFLRLE